MRTFPLDQVPSRLVGALTKLLFSSEPPTVPFALGGAFALVAYSGQWRESKDIDLYVLPEQKDAYIKTLMSQGYADYFEQIPYDRSWIFRSIKDDVIIDVIWGSANGLANVTERWLTAGPELEIAKMKLKVLPPEEFIWSKVYVFQKNRCDWPDLMNIIYYTGETLDWRHLLNLVGTEDRALIDSIMDIFVWIAPGQAARFPDWIWGELGTRPPPGSELINESHVRRVDSRPWFFPLMQQQEKAKQEARC